MRIQIRAPWHQGIHWILHIPICLFYFVWPHDWELDSRLISPVNQNFGVFDREVCAFANSIERGHFRPFTFFSTPLLLQIKSNLRGTSNQSTLYAIWKKERVNAFFRSLLLYDFIIPICNSIRTLEFINESIWKSNSMLQNNTHAILPRFFFVTFFRCYGVSSLAR